LAQAVHGAIGHKTINFVSQEVKGQYNTRPKVRFGGIILDPIEPSSFSGFISDVKIYNKLIEYTQLMSLA